MAEAPYDGWAIVELMGHRVRPGRVREVEMYGGKLLRLDIPADGGDITEFYGTSAIYAIRPCSEQVATDAARKYGDPRPVRPVDYRIEDRRATTGGTGPDFGPANTDPDPDASEFDDDRPF